MQRIVATWFSAVALIVLVGCWLLGWVIILMTSYGEYRGISQTDRPASYHLLTFGPWETGAGDCRPSEILQFPKDLTIIKHRVGHAYGMITQMVYYEAKYQMHDGTSCIAHATGPHSMISHRHGTFILVAGFCTVIAITLFLTSPRTSQPAVVPCETTNSTAGVIK